MGRQRGTSARDGRLPPIDSFWQAPTLPPDDPGGIILPYHRINIWRVSFSLSSSMFPPEITMPVFLPWCRSFLREGLRLHRACTLNYLWCSLCRNAMAFAMSSSVISRMPVALKERGRLGYVSASPSARVSRYSAAPLFRRPMIPPMDLGD